MELSYILDGLSETKGIYINKMTEHVNAALCGLLFSFSIICLQSFGQFGFVWLPGSVRRQDSFLVYESLLCEKAYNASSS